MMGKYTSYFDSPLSPWGTTFTLVCILCFSLLREAKDDVGRHRQVLGLG